MQPFPHQYFVNASGTNGQGVVVLSGPGLPPLFTGPPPEFDGPGHEWSPETLLVAAAADCFVLTFRAIARASHFAWTSLRCDGEGKLDRIDGTTRFTALTLHAQLKVPPGTDLEKAHRLIEKAERSCLIARSLAFETTLLSEIATEAALPRAADDED